MKNLAIITARGGSKRIPRKNIKMFCEKPIMAYSILAAIESGIFDQIMVSTDDKEIASIAKQYGATVPFLRSEQTSSDHASTADVVLEVINEYKRRNEEIDYACCIYPTAPFISAEKLKRAFSLLVQNDADSVVPVVRFGYPIQRAFKIENHRLRMMWPENLLARSQDLVPTFHDCGQFYFLKVSAFLKSITLFPENTIPIEFPESEVQDIDTEEDWILAEMKYTLMQAQQKNG